MRNINRQLNPQNKLALGLALVLALLIVNTAISFYNLRRVIDNNILVAHTHETLAELHDTVSTVQDIESAQRSYVITGEARYLQPYNSAVTLVQRNLKRLRVLLVTPQLSKRLPGLEREIGERLATSQRIIDARRDNDFEAARRLVQSGLGRREIDNIRRTLAGMIQTENELLLARNIDSRSSARSALLTFGVTSLLSLVLLGLAYTLVARDGVRQRRLAADLKAVESYAQNIVDTMREPLLMLDTSLRVRSANRAFYKTFQVSVAETEAHLIYELGNGQWDIPALRTLLEEIIPTSSVFNDYELEHDFPSIGRRVMLLNARQLRAGSDTELLVLAMEDVTERRRAERLLAEIETYAQNIVDTVREPLLMLDPTLRVRSANRAFYQTYQVSPTETEGQLIYELGNGQWDIPALRTLLEDIIPQKSVFNDYELEHDFPSIGRRVMLLNARELREGHHTDLLVLALEDVTERRRAERLLAEIESYAQNIVDTMREPLLMLDTSLRVRSANRAFYLTFRVAPEETEGRLIYELGNGQWDIPALRTLLEEIIPTKSVFNDYELAHNFPTIGERVMLLNARQLRAGIDTEILVLAMEDVTERRRVHDLEVRHTAELQESFKRLQELEKLRDDLTGMIIHDLRTPLSSVIAGMQTLELVGDLNEDQREMMGIAIEGGQTLLGMINDLLDVEKLESGTMQLEYSALNAENLIKGAVAQIASLAESKNLTLIQKIVPGLPSVQGDAGKLTRTLVNLLGNAIKFTPEGGVITVEARIGEDEKSLVFSVTDTGEGIPEESFGRIFEKFGQVESRKAGRMMSTGLGLTFCKLAVEAHGGHIAVESTPGEGATFCYAIPLAVAKP